MSQTKFALFTVFPLINIAVPFNNAYEAPGGVGSFLSQPLDLTHRIIYLYREHVCSQQLPNL